ncbi:MAG: hypothetical protein FJY85_22450 [Deltaproteobacteria bacterium]|nr:hypothetical protein [Deltaproteobacteria bacterium]
MSKAAAEDALGRKQDAASSYRHVLALASSEEEELRGAAKERLRELEGD